MNKELTRHEMAAAEMTRDPIFLLQRKGHIFNYDKARGHNLESDEFGFVWPNGVQASMQTLENLEVAIPFWENPHRVFYSRREAEKYAEDRKYDWGKKDKNWRVYCTCAEGELAQVLDRADAAKNAAKQAIENAK